MRILLLGADGQVGHELRGPLSTFADVTAAGRGTDLGDLDALQRTLGDAAPQVIVNAAAYTDVDGAEREPGRAYRVNAEAVAVLGEWARAHGAGLVHLSTDFVFDGTLERAYREDDATGPVNVYGRSKLEGERALSALDAPALVVRTAWVWSLRRKSFVSAMLRLARERPGLAVVADQVGNPTFCRDLAVALALVLHRMGERAPEALREARGVYHLAGTGACTRYDLAAAAIALDPKRAEHVVETIAPIATHEYPLPAARPLRTELDCSRFHARFGVALPPWREALARALAG